MEKIFNFIKTTTNNNIYVNVAKFKNGNKYIIDGEKQKIINLNKNKISKLIFQVSNQDYQNHPLKFSKTKDGTHKQKGEEYTNGIIVASNENITTITIHLEKAPRQLYYYCMKHKEMGSVININRKHSISVKKYEDGNKYAIDGEKQKIINLNKNKISKLIFQVSNQDYKNHPLKFSKIKDGKHNKGEEYTDVQIKQHNDNTKITIHLEKAPRQLYYYCMKHKEMGSVINIKSSSYFSEEDIEDMVEGNGY